jgi:hypothetical protein
VKNLNKKKQTKNKKKEQEKINKNIVNIKMSWIYNIFNKMKSSESAKKVENIEVSSGIGFYDNEDKLYFNISYNDTCYNITFKKECIIYDNFVVDVEETLKKNPEDDSYSPAELSGEGFRQPYGSFTLFNGEFYLKMSKNANYHIIEFSPADKHGPRVWSYCTEAALKMMYNDIQSNLQALEKSNLIRFKKSSNVILETPGVWIIYTCKKRTYEILEEQNSSYDEISDDSDNNLNFSNLLKLANIQTTRQNNLDNLTKAPVSTTKVTGTRENIRKLHQKTDGISEQSLDIYSNLSLD